MPDALFTRHRSTFTGPSHPEQDDAHTGEWETLMCVFPGFGPERGTRSEPGRVRAQCPNSDGQEVLGDRDHLIGN